MLREQEHHGLHSAELVINGSMAALAILTGAGAAFAFLRALHDSAAPVAGAASVPLIALGLALLGLGFENNRGRLFLFLMAMALTVTFFTGPTLFAAIAS